MTCGSRAPRASEAPRRTPRGLPSLPPAGVVRLARAPLAPALPLLALVTLALLAGAMPGGAQDLADAPGGAGPGSGPAGWPPRLELRGPGAADPALRQHRDDDRQWLARQPAGRLIAPAPADTAALRTWLRRAAATTAVAAGDTAEAATPYTGHRDLLSGLRDRWLARGHLDVRVRLATADPEATAPLVTVTPGPAFDLAALTVAGDDFPGRAGILASQLPRAGDRFRPEGYARAAQAVVAACAERGHPFAAWLTRDVQLDPASATATVSAVLIPGPRAVVGPQRATLASDRASTFTVRAAGVRSGEIFRESDLQRGRERLLARDLYARVDAPLVHLTTARDTVGILWRVEPLDRPNRLGVVLGLSRREEGGSRLSGQVDLMLPNLAGTGRSLRAAWNDDGQERATFGFAYHEPLVLGSPLDTDLALRSEVQQDVYSRFTATSNWQLPVIAFWGLELGAGWDRTTYPTGEVARSRRLRGRVALLHARGDRTRSGWSGTFAVETAQRRTSLREAADGSGDPDGGDLGREEEQRLLEVDLAGELWLRPTVSVAGHASFRQIDTDAGPLPVDELYRYGGATTLRGYREDEFRGESVAWGGLEVRLGRALRSRVYTFLDVGYFELSRRRDGVADGPLETVSDTQVGYGLGLLTAAAAGRLNLAVGFPGSVDFETAKLHVSLLGSF